MRIRLVCDGLDYGGWVRFGGRQIATFAGTPTPHVFDLSEHIQYIGDDNEIALSCLTGKAEAKTYIRSLFGGQP